MQNFSSRELPCYQNIYAAGLTLTYKKFCMGLFSLRILFQNSKCQRGKNVSCTSPGVLPYKVWFLHFTLELGMFLRRSYFFRSKLGWGKSQNLVMNRVRVLGSGPHTPTQLFWQYFPSPFPRDVHTGIPRMKVTLKIM